MLVLTASKKFEHLAAIRGIAAFVVLLAHIVQIFWLRIYGLHSLPHIISSEISYYAVVTFFVLSGFLITHSLESNVNRNGELKLSQFFAARIARLYPPFIFAITLSLVIYFVLDFFNFPGRNGAMQLEGDLYAAREIIHLPLRELLYALPMGSGLLEINGPLWSLYIEAKLYVLFACIYCVLQGRRSIGIFVAFAIVVYAGWRLNPEFGRYAAIWLIGCCAYYWTIGANIKRNKTFVLCVVLTLLIVAIDLCVRIVAISTLQAVGRVIGVDVLIAAAIAYLLLKLRLESRVGQQIADYSYTLYVIYFPILLLFQSILVSMGSRSIGIVIVFSILSGVTALGIARLGGKLEEVKDLIQQYLLTVWASITNKMCIIK